MIVSHGHLDHAGGAKHLQEKYGARLVMSAADYDLLDQQNPTWKPKRDMVATDGQKLTLGDTTLTLYLTPGHTEGTISTLIPVRDGGRPHLAAAWGGTLFNFGPIRPRLVAYARSAERFRDIVTKAGADIILSNHTQYDGTKAKLAALKTQEIRRSASVRRRQRRRPPLPDGRQRVRAGGRDHRSGVESGAGPNL